MEDRRLAFEEKIKIFEKTTPKRRRRPENAEKMTPNTLGESGKIISPQEGLRHARKGEGKDVGRFATGSRICVHENWKF